MVKINSKIFYSIVIISFLVGFYFLVNSLSGITGLSIIESTNEDSINTSYFIIGTLIIIAAMFFVLTIKRLKIEQKL